MNELEAHLSPNPIFTGLLQSDPAESTTRQLFGQLEVGHPIGHLLATPGVVIDPPADGDPFPYRASRWAGRATGDDYIDAARVAAAIPVVVSGLVSATPTGSINLRLRKQIDQ